MFLQPTSSASETTTVKPKPKAKARGFSHKKAGNVFTIFYGQVKHIGFFILIDSIQNAIYHYFLAKADDIGHRIVDASEVDPSAK